MRNVRIEVVNPINEYAVKESIKTFIKYTVLFELNDEETRHKIKRDIDVVFGSYLREVFESYEIVCNESNNNEFVIDNNTFVLDIFVDGKLWDFNIDTSDLRK